jgi:uncharacterized protein (TIGR02147 family)
MVDVKGFKEDYSWIAKQLTPSITAQEAKKAIEELLSLGLIKREPTGELKSSGENLSVGTGIVSNFLAQWHREMIQKGVESIERHPRETRDISTATVIANEENFKKIVEIIATARREILQIASNEERSGEKIYQVNFQVFPLSDKIRKEE